CKGLQRFTNTLLLSEPEFTEFSGFTEFSQLHCFCRKFAPSGASLPYSVFPGIWQENKTGKKEILK
ncbi:MAG: hypothetical protein FWC26_00810, partial [Fibromonadales bacterium]|nr:hypothetical protein [Fibromonadales bacterium]